MADLNKKDMLVLVQRQLEAYNRRDIDGFCDCFHSNVMTSQLATGMTISKGLVAFRHIYSKLFSSTPNLHCELKTRVVLDQTVVDEEIVTGIARSPQGIHAVAIYGFRDGKIDRVWFA